MRGCGIVPNEIDTGSEATIDSHRTSEAEFVEVVTDAVLRSYERLDRLEDRLAKLEGAQAGKDERPVDSRQQAAVS